MEPFVASSAYHAEVGALLIGLRAVQQLGVKDYTFLSDCQQLVFLLTEKRGLHSISTLVGEDWHAFMELQDV
ncbi:hypothetical protein FCM35_KLT06678 [Carex littledalei]|uniref:RNase H type-1 domain-containing protein n=1 Tax=Carex littledalei TaxID=544730 RepID=A0A833QVV2_9POAL|nr:hypothetical protein FCM35_KLT06678 [Carex littledalei]